MAVQQAYPHQPRPKHQRAEYFGHSVVYDRRLKNAQEEIVPEALYLHVLPAYEAEVHEHVQAHRKLHRVSRVFPLCRVERQPYGYGRADICEVQEIKQVVQSQPEPHRHRLKQQPHPQRGQIFFHTAPLSSRHTVSAIDSFSRAILSLLNRLLEQES